jgi:hypothetical protein
VLYVVLPVGYREAWWVDVRAAQMATLFLLIALLMLPDASADRDVNRSLALPLAALLAVANLVYVAKHMLAEHAWIEDYRQVVAMLEHPPRR